MRVIPLEAFVDEKGQTGAAESLGCTQGAISKALSAIGAGKKRIDVTVHDDGRAEADIIKPFGRKVIAKPADQAA